MRTIVILVVLSTTMILHGYGQDYFRSGIFLHHSTGGCIWGPNGSNTSVPQEMDEYNLAHEYTGEQQVTMNEEWWAPGDNEWVTQHAFFKDPSPVTGFGYYLPDNKIIVIKTCFPASAMSGAGQPSDTLTPYLKTGYNYKWHWRHIVRVMNQHRGNFFVIWTNAPLEPGSTNSTEAALSRKFCVWAKDTLAAGLDPEMGAFPPNVYVFDFFRKLTGPNGMMLPMYAAGAGDSHPNAAATALVAPQFVSEIFSASVAYELTSAIPESLINGDFRITVFPNPCRDETVIHLTLSVGQNVDISIFDQSGRMVQNIIDGYLYCGTHNITISTRMLNDGLYFIRTVREKTTRNVSFIVKS